MRGIIVYDGPSLLTRKRIVAIATLESRNPKTGPMVQLWILPARKPPLKALQTNDNAHICGDCPLQGQFKDGRMEDRVCYVNVGQAPNQVWRAWKAGTYVTLDNKQHRQMFRGRKLRLGAYGDPAALPVPLLRKLVSWCDGHTGYTHQTRTLAKRRARALASICMISCETLEQDREAKERGFRTFTVLSPGQQPPPDSVECPYYTHGVQCADCRLCGGLQTNAKSVYIRAHAKTGLNLPIIQDRLA